jgi:hypothetical protein
MLFSRIFAKYNVKTETAFQFILLDLCTISFMMIQAGSEYIYIVLVGAYYLYQAYSSSQKKKKEAMNGGKPSKPKPKGSFLEDILKEMEQKQEQINLPKPKPQPKPQPQHQFPVEKAKEQRASETKRRPMESQMTLDRFEKTESTMLRNSTIKGTLELDNFDSIEYNNTRASDTVRNEITDAPVKSSPKTIKILGRQISAKEAIISQIILERKV